MTRKMKLKLAIDFLMTILLLLLMAYQITGEVFHEWLGAGMLVLFLLHNILNIRWYKNLCKGRYKPLRILQTVVNSAVLIAILSLAYSGIVMSRHVFSFLPINSGMALARVMHLAGSYWGFVLMSIHLGLHWKMVVSLFGRLSGGKNRGIFIWIFRFLSVLTAGYGATCFYRLNILSYMFLKVEFAFLDYGKSAFTVFSEYLAIMGFLVFITYYLAKVIERSSVKISKRKENGDEKI